MNRSAASSYGGFYATPRTNATRATTSGARRAESASTQADYSRELHQNSQRKSYFIVAFLSLALVVGLVLKFNPSSGSRQGSASPESVAASGAEAGEAKAPRKVYTVEELKLANELNPPPIKPAPSKYPDTPIDESWADMADDNISAEDLDELPEARQEEIIERRNRIKWAREARAKREASSRTGSDLSRHGQED